jgi:hypothetical protein
MTYDFPATVQQDIQQYAQAEHISAEEAILKIVKVGRKTIRRKAQIVAPLSEDELRQLDGFGKTFGLLADVPDEDIDRMAATVRRMKREGSPARA